MLQSSLKLEAKIESLSLILAPLLLATSTFYWKNGEYDTTSATFMIVSLFCWLPAFKGLFGMTAARLPVYSVWGLWVAYFGCISGVCFAFLGYLTHVLNISHEQYLAALNNYPVTSQLLLFASGPLFPVSILLFGIQLLRKRLVPIAIAVLFCLAAIAFPLSRIPRVEWIAHVADVLLLMPCIYIVAARMRQESV